MFQETDKQSDATALQRTSSFPGFFSACKYLRTILFFARFKLFDEFQRFFFCNIIDISSRMRSSDHNTIYHQVVVINDPIFVLT